MIAEIYARRINIQSEPWAKGTEDGSKPPIDLGEQKPNNLKANQRSGSVMQNTSHAVMAQRAEARDSLDDFPTPPWATRALIEHVLDDKTPLSEMVCLEPACGAGHMAKVLAEYFGEVRSADIHPYGYGEVRDYLATPFETNSCDWVITNPPFRLGEQFVLRSLKVARKGVAILARTVFIESVGRYQKVFRKTPPTKFGSSPSACPW